MSNGLVYQTDRKPKSFLWLLFLFFLELVSRIWLCSCLTLTIIQIYEYICPNLLMYLSKPQDVFVKISKCICPNVRIYLSKNEKVFVKIAKYICVFLLRSGCPPAWLWWLWSRTWLRAKTRWDSVCNRWATLKKNCFLTQHYPLSLLMLIKGDAKVEEGKLRRMKGSKKLRSMKDLEI